MPSVAGRSASTWSGHSANSSSGSTAKRSLVANTRRGSITTVRKPSSRAKATRCTAMWPAPTISSSSGRGSKCTKVSTPSISSSALSRSEAANSQAAATVSAPKAWPRPDVRTRRSARSISACDAPSPFSRVSRTAGRCRCRPSRSAAHSSRPGSVRYTDSLPPHDRPTDQASSSSIPYSRRPGPRSPASRRTASSMTAPSIQPPLSDPATCRSAVTAIAPPGRRGAEPQVATTNASANLVPAACQRRTAASMSRIRVQTVPDSRPGRPRSGCRSQLTAAGHPP